MTPATDEGHQHIWGATDGCVCCTRPSDANPVAPLPRCEHGAIREPCVPCSEANPVAPLDVELERILERARVVTQTPQPKGVTDAEVVQWFDGAAWAIRQVRTAAQPDTAGNDIDESIDSMHDEEAARNVAIVTGHAPDTAREPK